jgi:hypothetical protein
MEWAGLVRWRNQFIYQNCFLSFVASLFVNWCFLEVDWALSTSPQLGILSGSHWNGQLGFLMTWIFSCELLPQWHGSNFAEQPPIPTLCSPVRGPRCCPSAQLEVFPGPLVGPQLSPDDSSQWHQLSDQLAWTLAWSLSWLDFIVFTWTIKSWKTEKTDFVDRWSQSILRLPMKWPPLSVSSPRHPQQNSCKRFS